MILLLGEGKTGTSKWVSLDVRDIQIYMRLGYHKSVSSKRMKIGKSSLVPRCKLRLPGSWDVKLLVQTKSFSPCFKAGMSTGSTKLLGNCPKMDGGRRQVERTVNRSGKISTKHLNTHILFFIRI